MYACIACMPTSHRSHKRALGPLKLSQGNCELPCGCWKPNLGPLDVFLVAELFFSAPGAPFLVVQSLPE